MKKTRSRTFYLFWAIVTFDVAIAIAIIASLYKHPAIWWAVKFTIGGIFK